MSEGLLLVEGYEGLGLSAASEGLLAIFDSPWLIDASLQSLSSSPQGILPVYLHMTFSPGISVSGSNFSFFKKNNHLD